MANKKTVTLKNKRGQNHPFDFAHALNLLRLQEKKGIKGWVLNEKNWEYKNHEITRKPNKREVKESDQ